MNKQIRASRKQPIVWLIGIGIGIFLAVVLALPGILVEKDSHNHPSIDPLSLQDHQNWFQDNPDSVMSSITNVVTEARDHILDVMPSGQSEAAQLSSGQEAKSSMNLLESMSQLKLQQPIGPIVPVYLTPENKIEDVPLEAYVRGVLAAEMPAEFELEALKAQAIAARTYLIRRLEYNDYSNVPVTEAWITDTVNHQAYLTKEEMQEKWEENYEEYLYKLTKAVIETEGLLAKYDGKPIQAAFFSTSNGYTENAEDYWNFSLPYLKSVESPWDEEWSPRYEQTVEIALQDVYKKLGVSTNGLSSSKAVPFRLLERTQSGRVKKVAVGNKEFTGREIREKLDLPSSHFEITRKGDQLTFITFGYGHGVGMSQWGAEGMAKAGHDYETILKHYYQGIKIEKWDNREKFLS